MGTTPKAWSIEEQIKLDFIQINNFCSLKTKDWEKIFASHISDKGLVVRIYIFKTPQTQD